MKRLPLFLTLILLLSSVFVRASVLDEIVPRPLRTELQKGTIRISGTAFKCDPLIDSTTLDAIDRFASRLGLVSGKISSVSSPMGLQASLDAGSAKGVFFIIDDHLGTEEYSISVGGKAAIVKAGGRGGFLYAIQTLKQMLPPTIYGTTLDTKSKWVLPCCTIEDKPRFAYRGMHLDCARHFWSVAQIKRYLDVMASYKLNRFHWHLTDDQGWRIEIKSCPLLTQIGSHRECKVTDGVVGIDEGARCGGFYSQDDIRGIIKYAASLGITVIPEIELPGHALAALVSYPWLGCTGHPYHEGEDKAGTDHVFCAGKETTYGFFEKVLEEVASLFPGEYIHIGGDECRKADWEKCPDCQKMIANLGLKGDEKFSAEQHLQSYMTARVQRFLGGKGKKIIGWDEIMEGELSEGATVMSWRGDKGGREAAAQGFDVIMTPEDYMYFDCSQASEGEPEGNGGLVTLDRVYSYEPLEGMNEDQAAHISGVQANLWTEYIATQEQLEYMLLPRLLALSEVQWCSPDRKDYTRFCTSLQNRQYTILDKAGYNYRKNK